MRTISITTEVFSMIWANRIDGEESENAILSRLLKSKNTPTINMPSPKLKGIKSIPPYLRNANWWEVIKFVLEGKLNQEASLDEIYKETRNVCNTVGRSIPRNLEATIRGTLENNSSDSEKYTRVRDVFYMSKGKGAGVWALRQKS